MTTSKTIEGRRSIESIEKEFNPQIATLKNHLQVAIATGNHPVIAQTTHMLKWLEQAYDEELMWAMDA